MVTVDVGLLKTANGLIMLLNLGAAIAAIVFWEIHFKNYKWNQRKDAEKYYLFAMIIAMVIVAIVFFLTLCGKLTKRVLALIAIIIAAILVIAAVIVILVKDNQHSYRTFSMMCAAVLGGGLVANLVYTGVGGLRINT